MTRARGTAGVETDMAEAAPPRNADAPNADAPVVAIDGPAASGKGTIAWNVAQALRFHYLDSGSLYRLIALRALERDVAADDAAALEALAADLDVSFPGGRATLGMRC